MTKTILAGALTAAICAASLPASAQTGRIDPGVGNAQLPITSVQYRDGPRWRHGGPGWNRGYGWRGNRGYGWRGNRGYGYGVGAGIAGLAAGALIGGAIASQAAPVYAAPPVVDGDATGYCMQRFKSYDPGSGTYLGYDGLRHPCP